MADLPSAEQVSSATTWFTTQAGITATVLAFVAIVEAAFIVWLLRSHRKQLDGASAAAHSHWSEKFKLTEAAWAMRIDNFRTDVKEAFGQNANIADKVIEALGKLQIEIARMGARRGD